MSIDWDDPHLRRFLSHVAEDDDENGCSIWQAAVAENGYGRFRLPENAAGQATTWAHRAAWILLRGPITHNLTVDHLCRVKTCVNVDHMELVPGWLNTQRGARPWTTCERYHPSEPARWVKRNEGRVSDCLECKRVRESWRRSGTQVTRPPVLDPVEL